MLNVTNLYKSYKDKQVLKGLSLNLEDGKIYALVGVNGAGKSTLMECVCGLKTFQEGEIFIDGLSPKKRKENKQIKKIIGFMPQTFSMFGDLTVKENLEYLSIIYELKKERVDEVIEMCNLKNRQKDLAKNLSGGYKQLLSLAASIIHNPKLLILDEPTSAMDPLFRKSFWQIIHAINEGGTTILVTTHYLEEIQECNEILLLALGKIIHNSKVENMYENGKFNSVYDIIDYYILKENNE